MTEYVKVPKHELERLEQARKELWEELEASLTHAIPMETYVIILNLTNEVLRVANTKWEDVK